MAAILAFFTSPLGLILVKEVPGLVSQVVKIANEKGMISAAEVAAYINSQRQWDAVPINE